MFGSSTGSTILAKEDTTATNSTSKPNAGLGSTSDGVPIKSADGSSNEAVARSNGDSTEGSTGGKRRSSGFAKVLKHLSGSPNYSAPDNSLVSQSTTLQKLGKTDPALSVPQGSLNNSAGESRPGPRSTFRVGVTEDKNKKCRRTMEDTHAYLYNFLSTPAPSLGLDGESTGGLGVKDDGDQAHSSHVVETDNGYFAVFDGHAGTFAADWCGKKLHVLLEEMIRKYPNTPVPELLDQTFTNVDQQLEKLPVKNSGCTAITAVLRWEDRIPNAQSTTGSSAIAPAAAAAAKAASESAANIHAADGSPKSSLHSKSAVSTTNASSVVPKLQDSATRQRVLYTANVGDARIVLCRNGKALRLSYDHKGSDENEGKRISNAGGLILNNRVNGVLAVTRALGDAYMKDLVTGHPYTTETVIQPDIDEFLILACDGLWDVCSDQEAVDLVRHIQDPQVASKMLVDHALARFSTDNLSCMIVRFDSKALQQSVDRKTEPIGVEGDPPSTIKGGISEADAIVKEARKSMNLDDEKRGIGRESIKEEEQQEAGHGTNSDAVKQMPRPVKNVDVEMT